MLPRLVALCAASAILLGLVSTVAASIGEPTHAAQTHAARADVDYRAEIDGLPTLSEDALTPEAEETTTTATQTTEPRDEGFDDWGLLGLLGLAGLAGLRRPPVHPVVEERRDGAVTRRP